MAGKGKTAEQAKYEGKGGEQAKPYEAQTLPGMAAVLTYEAFMARAAGRSLSRGPSKYESFVRGLGLNVPANASYVFRETPKGKLRSGIAGQARKVGRIVRGLTWEDGSYVVCYVGDREAVAGKPAKV